MIIDTEELNFHIVTPSLSDNPWLEECIQSVSMQTENAHHHVVIDEYRKGACRNHFETLQKIDPVSSNIVIHLDGDDRLLTHKVLFKLKQEYSKENTWVTYGNYVSRQQSVCRPIDQRSFRDSVVQGGWAWSHLRTFRANLIPYLKEEDMKDGNGQWYTSASDVAIFLPILEMAGKSRVKFIDEDLVYYRIHQENDHANPDKLRDQVRCALDIYRRGPYKVL